MLDLTAPGSRPRAVDVIVGAASARVSSPPFIMSWFIDGLLAHVLLVGLLFALVARWSAARRTQA